jgi:hypothetical protein
MDNTAEFHDTYNMTMSKFVYIIHNTHYVLIRHRAVPINDEDDDDVYLDTLQTRGVRKSILYM